MVICMVKFGLTATHFKLLMIAKYSLFFMGVVKITSQDVMITLKGSLKLIVHLVFDHGNFTPWNFKIDYVIVMLSLRNNALTAWC